jgi:hypothetical protein
LLECDRESLDSEDELLEDEDEEELLREFDEEDDDELLDCDELELEPDELSLADLYFLCRLFLSLSLDFLCFFDPDDGDYLEAYFFLDLGYRSFELDLLRVLTSMMEMGICGDWF